MLLRVTPIGVLLCVLAGCSSSQTTTTVTQIPSDAGAATGCAAGDPSGCGCPSGSTASCSASGLCLCSTPSPVEAGPVSPFVADFAGNWSPESGSGEETCTDGQSTPLPPDTAAVFPIVKDSFDTLNIHGAGMAAGCSLELQVVGATATPVVPNPSCSGVVYTTFVLAFLPPGSTAAGDAGDDGGAPDATAVDAGDGGALDTNHLDWHLVSQFTDPAKTCTSTLHYTLVRGP